MLFMRSAKRLKIYIFDRVSYHINDKFIYCKGPFKIKYLLKMSLWKKIKIILSYFYLKKNITDNSFKFQQVIT